MLRRIFDIAGLESRLLEGLWCDGRKLIMKWRERYVAQMRDGVIHLTLYPIHRTCLTDASDLRLYTLSTTSQLVFFTKVSLES